MATGSRSGSLSSLREFNRLRLVDFLRTNGTASRAELARRTGLSRSTVSTLVAELQRRGLVVERAGQFAGEGQPGRPAALLELDPVRRRRRGHRLRPRQGASGGLRPVAQRARRGHAPRHDVDHDAQGRSTSLPSWSSGSSTRPTWRGTACSAWASRSPARSTTTTAPFTRRTCCPAGSGVDAADELEGRLETARPTSTTTPTWARSPRSTLGAGRNASFAAYVSISSGIGAGIIVDGRPYRGHRGTAGEIGHVLVDEQGPICRCGNRGCLETLASGPALSWLLRTRAATTS